MGGWVGVRSWILCPIYDTGSSEGEREMGMVGGGRKGEENMSNRQLQLYHIVTNVLVKKVERKENKARAG